MFARAASALVLAAGVLAGHAGVARANYEPPPPAPTHAASFWRGVNDPNADEADALTAKARDALAAGDRARGNDLDTIALENRDRMVRELVDLLGYLRKLEPTDAGVLAMLGSAADDAGRTRLAIEAFTAAFAAHAEPDIAARLAGLYLRRGDLDAALAWARRGVALDTVRVGRGDRNPVIALASVLEQRGDTAGAIDALVLATTDRPAFAQLALAVAYDRDDQPGEALEVIARLQSALAESFAEEMASGIALYRFAPPEDVHYFRALLAEIVGDAIGARAEWLTYAAGGGTFAARARAHVAALDAARAHAQPALIPFTPPPRLPPPHWRGGVP